jgi:hypothetical protein
MSDFVKKIKVGTKNFDIDAKRLDGFDSDAIIIRSEEVDCVESDDYLKTIKPNKYYIFKNVSSLTVKLGDQTEHILNNYMFQVTFTNSGNTLTIPEEISWANDITPSICETGGTYQISIINNLGVLQKF